MSIYRMNGKTKVAELTTQNVNNTTQVFNDANTELGASISFVVRNGIAFIIANGTLNKSVSTNYTTAALPQSIYDAVAPLSPTGRFTVLLGGSSINGNGVIGNDRRIRLYFRGSANSGDAIAIFGSWPTQAG